MNLENAVKNHANGAEVQAPAPDNAEVLLKNSPEPRKPGFEIGNRANPRGRPPGTYGRRINPLKRTLHQVSMARLAKTLRVPRWSGSPFSCLLGRLHLLPRALAVDHVDGAAQHRARNGQASRGSSRRRWPRAAPAPRPPARVSGSCRRKPAASKSGRPACARGTPPPSPTPAATGACCGNRGRAALASTNFRTNAERCRGTWSGRGDAPAPDRRLNQRRRAARTCLARASARALTIARVSA